MASAVHIAAAISSYARIIINDFKNIPGNPCIMSDTDSVVLPYPLSEKIINLFFKNNRKGTRTNEVRI
jgi:hypothetical protein